MSPDSPGPTTAAPEHPHDQALARIREALDGDTGRPAGAIRAVLLGHVSQPAPHGGPDPGCIVCEGTGLGVVDGRVVHCCCGCPVCATCTGALCGPYGPEACETVGVLAAALGVGT